MERIQIDIRNPQGEILCTHLAERVVILGEPFALYRTVDAKGLVPKRGNAWSVGDPHTGRSLAVHALKRDVARIAEERILANGGLDAVLKRREELTQRDKQRGCST